MLENDYLAREQKLDACRRGVTLDTFEEWRLALAVDCFDVGVGLS